ncbi:MAG: BatA domain-containing protein [Aureliella sp.]
MGFVQTGFLFTLAAIAVPLLVHLLSRWQVRRLELGTMHFLQEVIRDAAHRRRVRRWLLLATRLALVALLGLLFTRPFLPDVDSRDGKRLRIVLVDRSASMMMKGQSGRVLDDAIAEATKLFDQAGSDATVEVAWFDRDVEPLPAGTSRLTAAKSTSSDTDYFAALAWARDRLATSRSPKAEVILVSDMQLSGLSSDSAEGGKLGLPLNFPKNVPVRIVDVGRPAASNLAIMGLESQAKQLPPGAPLRIEVTLFNYGSLPAEEVPATATAVCGERSIRLKKTINVAPDQAGEVAFEFGPVGAGIWVITVDIDASDDLAVDNRRLTSIEVMKPLPILVLDPGSSAESLSACSFNLTTALQETSRLERFAGDRSGAEVGSGLGSEPSAERGGPSGSSSAPASFSRFAVEQCFLEDAGMPDLSQRKPPLVVVADAGAMPVSALDELEEYVRSGGRLLVFAGQSVGSPLSDAWLANQLAPGALAASERSSVMPFRIVSIAERGSMLDPFRDPQHGDLSRLAFTSLVHAEVDDTERVLAWFDGKRPAITEHAVGNGRVAWFLSSADSRSSNWTISPLYLPLVRQMASGLLGLTGEGPIRFRNVGDPVGEHQAIAAKQTSQPSIQQVADRSSGRNPDRNDERNAGRDGQTKTPPSKSITFEQPGFQRTREALFVVNTSARESDPARIEAARFAEQCGLVLASEDGEPAGKVEVQGRKELWPWLAAALIVLLVAEFALANRTPT